MGGLGQPGLVTAEHPRTRSRRAMGAVPCCPHSRRTQLTVLWLTCGESWTLGFGDTVDLGEEGTQLTDVIKAERA